jgi:hypothetical protein
LRATLGAVVIVVVGCGARQPEPPHNSAEWLAQCSPQFDEGCPTEREREAAAAERDNIDLLLTRARFDLQCPEATAQVLEMHTSGPATLVGAAGCGRQAQYERRLRHDGWRGGHTTRNTKWERRQ